MGREEDKIFQVGDEVIRHWKYGNDEGDDKPSVCIEIRDGHLRCLSMENGFPSIISCPVEQYRKTGNFYPVAEIFEHLRSSIPDETKLIDNDKISGLMDSMGVTVSELSRRSGIPKSTVSRVVSGRIKDPKISTVKKIAEALNIKVWDIML